MQSKSEGGPGQSIQRHIGIKECYSTRSGFATNFISEKRWGSSSSFTSNAVIAFRARKIEPIGCDCTEFANDNENLFLMTGRVILIKCKRD